MTYPAQTAKQTGLSIRLFRNAMAHFHGMKDLEDLDAHYTPAWFEKLRHHGFNGLWIGEWLNRLVAFREPENADQNRRLNALRRLIDKAARFDAGAYLFLRNGVDGTRNMLHGGPQ